MTKILCIYGLGKIGRECVKELFNLDGIEIRCLVDSHPVDEVANLFNLDTTYDNYFKEHPIDTRTDKGTDYIILEGKEIPFITETTRTNLPLAELNIDCVIDASGEELTNELLDEFLSAGSKKAIGIIESITNPLQNVAIMNLSDSAIFQQSILYAPLGGFIALGRALQCLNESAGIIGADYLQLISNVDGKILTEFNQLETISNMKITQGNYNRIGYVLPSIMGKVKANAHISYPVGHGSLMNINAEINADKNIDEIKVAFKSYADKYFRYEEKSTVNLNGSEYFKNDKYVSFLANFAQNSYLGYSDKKHYNIWLGYDMIKACIGNLIGILENI